MIVPKRELVNKIAPVHTSTTVNHMLPEKGPLSQALAVLEHLSPIMQHYLCHTILG